MNKLYYWIIGSLLLVLAACSESEDDDVRVTNLDLDYYVVSPDYNNAIDSLRYAIYVKYDIPTFYDDTIGVYDRGEYDRDGNPHPFYKVLYPAYTITGWDQSLEITEVEDKETLRPVLEAMLNYTFDDFPKAWIPKGFYIVEDFHATEGVDEAYYKGMDCSLVAVSALIEDEEGAQTQEEMGASLRASMAVEALLDKEGDRLDAFYGVSERLSAEIYGSNDGELEELGIYNPDEDEPMDLGFLEFYTDWFGVSYAPNSDQDLLTYVNLYFHNTREDVIEMYGEYTLVVEKYDILATIMEDYMNTQFTE